MNFSGLSSHSAIGKLLRLPLHMVPRELPVPILQGPLQWRLWIAGSSSHGCWLGSYEYHKQRLFARMARAGDVVFDIGANVGFYTLLAASRVAPSGRVVAFEPMPSNVKRIHQHLKLNRIDGVRVFEAAVSSTPGIARFAPHASNAMGRISDTGSMEVTLVSLDDLSESGSIPDPNLLKIDVEGAELGVLHGASRLLARARPTILLATHGAEVHRQCCAFLRDAGYELRPIDPSVATLDATDEVIATRGT